MFLQGVVADADRLLAMARVTREQMPADDPKHLLLDEAAPLLRHLLWQDIERGEEGARLKQGVSQDRLVAVHDPEMRHGRKSAAKRFDGHKVARAVDPDSQLITAAAVLAGNAQDHERALQRVEQAAVNAEGVVAETVGDCAYGDGATRQACADAGRKLVATVANRSGQAQCPKEAFRSDLVTMSCVGPGGHESRTIVSISSGERYGAPGVPLRAFRFDAVLCAAGPLRPWCVRARPGKGRLVMLHPPEALLQEARAFQQSGAFAPYRQLRQVAAHRLARLMPLGMRQARYCGRATTLCPILLAATVANLTLVATRLGLVRSRRHPQPSLSVRLGGLMALLNTSWPLFTVHTPNSGHCPRAGFRPHF
jgi:DDE family transposase